MHFISLKSINLKATNNEEVAAINPADVNTILKNVTAKFIPYHHFFLLIFTYIKHGNNTTIHTAVVPPINEKALITLGKTIAIPAAAVTIMNVDITCSAVVVSLLYPIKVKIYVLHGA